MKRWRRRLSKEIKDYFQGRTETICGAEIGVAKGNTAEDLLNDIPNLSLLLIDPWKWWPHGHRFRINRCGHARLSAREQQRSYELVYQKMEKFGERAKICRKESLEAVRELDNNSLDTIFIDADHSYEGVKEDLNAWYPKMKPGSLLLGHDYDSIKEGKGLWGVKRAVDEFATQNNLNLEILEFSLWKIKKPAGFPSEGYKERR